MNIDWNERWDLKKTHQVIDYNFKNHWHEKMVLRFKHFECNNILYLLYLYENMLLKICRKFDYGMTMHWISDVVSILFTPQTQTNFASKGNEKLTNLLK